MKPRTRLSQGYEGSVVDLRLAPSSGARLTRGWNGSDRETGMNCWERTICDEDGGGRLSRDAYLVCSSKTLRTSVTSLRLVGRSRGHTFPHVIHPHSHHTYRAP